MAPPSIDLDDPKVQREIKKKQRLREAAQNQPGQACQAGEYLSSMPPLH